MSTLFSALWLLTTSAHYIYSKLPRKFRLLDVSSPTSRQYCSASRARNSTPCRRQPWKQAKECAATPWGRFRSRVCWILKGIPRGNAPMCQSKEAIYGRWCAECAISNYSIILHIFWRYTSITHVSCALASIWYAMFQQVPNLYWWRVNDQGKFWKYVHIANRCWEHSSIAVQHKKHRVENYVIVDLLLLFKAAITGRERNLNATWETLR